jgi:hypothetical protein
LHVVFKENETIMPKQVDLEEHEFDVPIDGLSCLFKWNDT